MGHRYVGQNWGNQPTPTPSQNQYAWRMDDSGNIIRPNQGGNTPTRRNSSIVNAGQGGWQPTSRSLIDQMSQLGQNVRKEWDVPYQEALKMMENPGMTAEEANLTYGRNADAIDKWYQDAAASVNRQLPSGVGATGEAFSELQETALGQKMQSRRDIDIERASSAREGKTSALEMIGQILQAKQQFDIMDMQSASDLLAQVATGDVTPELLQMIQYAIQSGTFGGNPAPTTPGTGQWDKSSIRGSGNNKGGGGNFRVLS